ncbi:MAG: DUF4097 family beta strand repeat-containing protein [Pseudohongiella sp.]
MNSKASWTSLATLVLLMALGQMVHAAENPVTIDETRQVSANERIEIEVMRGQVVIRTGTDNTFRVSGTLDELAEGYELRSGNGFTFFEVQMPRNIRNNGSRREQESDLVFVVPANSNVSYSGVNADVNIDGITGGSDVTTVNGDITAANLSEYIELRTVNGAIDSRNNRGRIDLHTVNGEVRDAGSDGRISYGAVNGDLDIDSAAQEVEISVVNGSVRADLRGTDELDLNSVNGDIDVILVDVSSPRISGSTVSGDITLTLPSDVNARFSMQSIAGGSIINNITDDEVVRARFGPARNLDFSTGEGVGTVELSSVSGRLELNAN